MCFRCPRTQTSGVATRGGLPSHEARQNAPPKRAPSLLPAPLVFGVWRLWWTAKISSPRAVSLSAAAGGNQCLLTEAGRPTRRAKSTSLSFFLARRDRNLLSLASLSRRSRSFVAEAFTPLHEAPHQAPNHPRCYRASLLHQGFRGSRCRANMARVRQSRPYSGPGLQATVLETFEQCPLFTRRQIRARSWNAPPQEEKLKNTLNGIRVLPRKSVGQSGPLEK